MNDQTKMLQWIESQGNEMINTLEKWVNVNSWSENIAGLENMLKILLEDFSILQGDEIKIEVLPKRRIISSKGIRIETDLGKALSIRKRINAPIKILLAGHMDTVFPQSSTLQGIFKADKQQWKGPGITDMKGGLLVLLKSLEAWEKSPIKDKLGWEILITPDEEIGSVGSHDLYMAAAKRNHVGIIFEPAFSDGAFVNQRKGSANFTLIVRGLSAHAGRDFHHGRSAIYAIADILHKLESLNHLNNSITLNAGRIEGGGPVNIVPDLAICKLNLRTSTEEEMIEAKRKIEEIISKPREGFKTELVEDYCRVPKLFDEKTKNLFKDVETCANELNIPFQLRESGGVCDGNILSEAGLPTFDSAGVVGGKIHTEEEYIYLPSLVERTKLTYLLLSRLALG